MKMHIKNKPLWAYVILTYAITWLIQLPGILALNGNYQFTNGFLIVLTLSSFGPSLAAFIVTAFCEGKSEIHSLLKRLIQWRVPLLLYVIVFYLFPFVLFIGYQVMGIKAAPDGSLFGLFLTLVVAAPINSIISQVILGVGPLGEELGWRGFIPLHF